MIYFNWYELYVKAKKDHNSILILTYALSVGYNQKIAKRISNLMAILQITHVTRDCLRFIRQEELYKRKGFTLYSNIKTIEPQSYFKNSSFLRAKHHVTHKVNYIKLLSYRRIDDSSPFIYKDILTEKQLHSIENNPFVKVGDTQIYFIREFT